MDELIYSTVGVWLCENSTRDGWQISKDTTDGNPLPYTVDAEGNPHTYDDNVSAELARTASTLLDQAQTWDAPTGRELLDLLADAYGYTLTAKPVTE